jgi:hypothetical protein
MHNCNAEDLVLVYGTGRIGKSGRESQIRQSWHVSAQKNRTPPVAIAVSRLRCDAKSEVLV